MEMTKTNLPKLDVDFILNHGKIISSQEAISEVTPINWSNKVLHGDYVDRSIIESKDKNEVKKNV